jgi:hypothetical protein
MAEQISEIPEAWVGQEVAVYYGQRELPVVGTLVSVSEKGIVVRHMEDGIEQVYWYPHSSVARLLQGRSPY